MTLSHLTLRSLLRASTNTGRRERLAPDKSHQASTGPLRVSRPYVASDARRLHARDSNRAADARLNAAGGASDLRGEHTSAEERITVCSYCVGHPPSRGGQAPATATLRLHGTALRVARRVWPHRAVLRRVVRSATSCSVRPNAVLLAKPEPSRRDGANREYRDAAATGARAAQDGQAGVA